jgi:methylphosphotriester-DNA--protein-cysteine methyltransferase
MQGAGKLSAVDRSWQFIDTYRGDITKGVSKTAALERAAQAVGINIRTAQRAIKKHKDFMAEATARLAMWARLKDQRAISTVLNDSPNYWLN